MPASSPIDDAHAGVSERLLIGGRNSQAACDLMAGGFGPEPSAASRKPP